MSNRRKTKEERELKKKNTKERINKNTKIDKKDETTSTVESVLKSMNIKLDPARERNCYYNRLVNILYII